MQCHKRDQRSRAFSVCFWPCCWHPKTFPDYLKLLMLLWAVDDEISTIYWNSFTWRCIFHCVWRALLGLLRSCARLNVIVVCSVSEKQNVLVWRAFYRWILTTKVWDTVLVKHSPSLSLCRTQFVIELTFGNCEADLRPREKNHWGDFDSYYSIGTELPLPFIFF